jgi:predicted dehydrogenase
MKRKLLMGMVGGGGDTSIGATHQMAAGLDRKIEFVGGVFSSNPEKTRQVGENLGLSSSRVYDDYHAMAAAEAKLPVGERIDFATIVTPNHLHFPVAKTFLEAGFQCRL